MFSKAIYYRIDYKRYCEILRTRSNNAMDHIAKDKCYTNVATINTKNF